MATSFCSARATWCCKGECACVRVLPCYIYPQFAVLPALLVAETAPHGVRGWFGDAACCASVVGALVLPLAATLAQWRSWRLLGRWLQFSGLLLHGHAHGAGLLAATHARSPRLRRPAVAETVGWPTGRRMMQSGCACEVRSSLAVRALLRAVITVAISKLVAVLASADEADEADWLPPPAASTVWAAAAASSSKASMRCCAARGCRAPKRSPCAPSSSSSSSCPPSSCRSTSRRG